MKGYHFIWTLWVAFWTVGANAQVEAPAPSPFSKLVQKVGLTDVTVEYSRPSMKNRIVFGDLVPFEAMWRTGANASTKVTFGDDVVIDGKPLAKGTYALYTVPREYEWDFVFYKDTEQWGVPKDYDRSQEALRITVESEEIPWTVETFTIDLNNLRNNSAKMILMWESTIAGFTFQVDTDSKVQASIDKTFGGPSSGDYYSAANYYFTNDKELGQALEWVKKANELSEKFWQLRLQSLIEAKLGDKKSAISTAKRSLELAQAAGYDNYVQMNRASIEEWSASAVEEEGVGNPHNDLPKEEKKMIDQINGR